MKSSSISKISQHPVHRLPNEIHLIIAEQMDSRRDAINWFEAVLGDNASAAPQVQEVIRASGVWPRSVRNIRARVTRPSADVYREACTQHSSRQIYDNLRQDPAWQRTNDIAEEILKWAFCAALVTGDKSFVLGSQALGLAYANYALARDTRGAISIQQRALYVANVSGYIGVAVIFGFFAAAVVRAGFLATIAVEHAIHGAHRTSDFEKSLTKWVAGVSAAVVVGIIGWRSRQRLRTALTNLPQTMPAAIANISTRIAQARQATYNAAHGLAQAIRDEAHPFFAEAFHRQVDTVVEKMDSRT